MRREVKQGDEMQNEISNNIILSHTSYPKLLCLQR